MDAKQAKIVALTNAKDDMEKALAKLRVEGYNSYNLTYKALEHSIDTLRSDIIGLQTGIYPFVSMAQ